MPEAAVVLREVGVDADSTQILRRIDLEVARGECVVLVGRSGAGKSTCLRLINGLVQATRGEVIVEGRSIGAQDLIALRRRIGYVIQHVGLLPHLDVRANVGVVPRLAGWSRTRIDERVDEVLTLVGLDPVRFGARRPAELSGGERQRVGVARALAAEPGIVLMDEPFGALDPLTRVELQRDVDALRRRLGTTVVLVTHDVREAIALGDRIALVDDGTLPVVADPLGFLESSHPVAAAYAASLRDGDAAIARRLRPAAAG